MSLLADDLRLANASTPWALRARLPSPSTPQHGRFTCRLKIYVYRQFLHHLQQQQHSGRWFGFSDTRRVTGATRNVTRNVSCLEGPCIFNGFKYLNVRQYTSEVPIYQRLVTACTVVDEPERGRPPRRVRGALNRKRRRRWGVLIVDARASWRHGRTGRLLE